VAFGKVYFGCGDGPELWRRENALEGSESKMSNCPNCGAPVQPESSVCARCGSSVAAQQQQPGYAPPSQQSDGKVYPSNPPKSAVTATILSCFFPGVGQMYLGQVIKGVVILVAGIVLSTVTSGIAGLPVWIVAMIDANNIAKKLASGRPVGQWEFF
jgi:TM2 domain-containing membrane protein YozV